MNLLSLQDEIGRLLNDPSHTRWSTDVLTSRINLAQTEIQGFTNAIKTIENVTPVVNQATVTMGSDVMDIVHATKTSSDGQVLPFRGTTRQELDFLYPNWHQWSPGEPIFWVYEPRYSRVILAPPPDSNWAVTDGLSFWESLVPTELVNPTDIPFDSQAEMIPYHMSIVHWVVAQCWMDDGVPESLGKAKFHKSGNMMSPGQYELQLSRITSEFDTPEVVPSHIMFRPQGARIGTWFIPNKSNPFDF